MRRLIAVVGMLAVALAVVSAPVSASQTTPIDGHFHLVWQLKADAPRNAPCEAGTLCAPGTLSPYGLATITINRDKFAESDDPNCFAVIRTETVHLLSGDGDLVLKGSGAVCFPGHSLDAHDETSYGNPTMWTFELTVQGAASTGIFAGATGSVHESFMFAGAIGMWTLTGSITGAASAFLFAARKA